MSRSESTGTWPGLKLASMGVLIDELTPRQQEYLASWTHGI